MADTIRSIHVPASTVQRLLSLWRWILPYVTGACIAALGFSTRWLESRVSREELATAIGEVAGVARAAQSTAFHADSLVSEHADQLGVMWRRIVMLEAELMVYRDYGRADPQKRGRLIEGARRFYSQEFETQLRTRANDPAEAARLAFLTPWRPGP